MFHTTPPTPTKSKRVVYLVASTILGSLLGFILYDLVQILHIYLLLKFNLSLTAYQDKPLWPFLHDVFFVLGAVGGFFLGKFWWQKVYVEQVWWRNKK